MIITKRRKNNPLIPICLSQNGGGWSANEACTGTVWETGPKNAVLAKMSAAVDEAREIVCLQSFLMDDNDLMAALIRAQQRGVRVYVSGSAEARLGGKMAEEVDRHFSTANFIKLLEEKFRNRVLFRSAPDLHAKFLLVDPKSKQAQGFLCTQNLTEFAFAKNPELTVKLNATQVRELFKVFVYHFWEHTDHEKGTGKDFLAVKPARRFEFPELKKLVLTSPEKGRSNLKPTLREAIANAVESLVVSTFSIESSQEVVKDLLAKTKAGLKVTIFARKRPGNHLPLRELALAGAEIYVEPRIHAKFLIADGKEGYLFSANYTAQGLDSGYEVGLRLSQTQIKELKSIYKRWQSDFPWKMVVNKPLDQLFSEFIEIDKGGNEEGRKVTLELLEKETKRVATLNDLRQLAGQEMKEKAGFHLEQIWQLEMRMNQVPKDHTLVKTLQPAIQIIELPGKKKKQKGERALMVSPQIELTELMTLPIEYNNYKIYQRNE